MTTLSWMNLRAAAVPVAAVAPMSSVTASSLRPLIPPLSLICWMAYSIDSWLVLLAVGPVRPTAMPILIDSAPPLLPEPPLLLLHALRTRAAAATAAAARPPGEDFRWHGLALHFVGRK